MNRKEFIKTCGYGCLGASSIGLVLQSCVASRSITCPIENDDIVVPLSAFIKVKKDKQKILDYVIVSNEKLQYPIYVFRFSETEYNALYLTCTHQGNELSAYGEKLVCSAHGSEFDNRGNVTNGPAFNPLKSFPTKIDSQNIKISLKSEG